MPTRRKGCTVGCLNKYAIAVLLGAISAAVPNPCCAGDGAPTANESARIPQLGWRLDGDALMRFGQGLETPHTRWADPWYAGKLKVLCLANGSGAYDVCELTRRVSMEVHGFPTLTWFRLGDWYWLWMWLEQSTGSERAATLENLLDERFDAIVLANFRFASLNEACQYKILRQVADGAGLVMFYRHDFDPRLLAGSVPGAPAAIGNGVPFAGLDFYRNWFMPSRDLVTPDRIPPALIQAHTFGRGRVLVVDYNEQSSLFAAAPGAIVPSMEYDYTAPVRYDYHQQLAARCLLWAATREPRLKWTTPLPDGMEAEALVKPRPVRLAAAWPPDAGEDLRGGLTRRLRVRNLWGEVLDDREDVVVATGNTVQWDLSLPAMPSGWYFADCIVSSKRGIENFASFAIRVRSPLAIESIRPTATFYDTGEAVRGQIVLSAPVSAGQDVKLSVWLEDGHGRVFSRMASPLPVPPGSDRADFEMPQGNLASWGARLRVALLVGDKAVHRSEVEIRLRRPSRGEYPIAMWGAIADYGNHVGNLQMRELGFTAVLSGDPLPQARDDIGWMTFGSGRGAIIHSLGDEIPVPKPPKGDKLNEFLKKRYASLDDLNRAWDTSFARWEDVEPMYKATDGNAGSFVRMHDCLSAGEFQFADNIRTRREAIEKVNPPGVVGPEGSPVGDPELTLAEATFWGPYLTVRDNLLVNALGRPGVLRGNWFGGYVEDRRVPTRNRHVLWMSILGGNNMIEYFTIGSGLLAPDLTMMPFTEEFVDSWQQIRLGIGPQLARCRPAGNPVALLHSQPSQHIGEAGGSSTDTVKAHEYLLNLLGDAGYSPQYVSTRQVREGRLKQGDIKVLFLIHAFALSDDEVAAIRGFAEKGGMVIADIPPAWFDEKCRLRPIRVMDDFFGIAAPAVGASLEQRRFLMNVPGSVESPFGPARLRGSDVEITDRETKRPASFLTRAQGNGRSMFINGVLWKEGREDPATVQTYRRIIEGLAGTRPVFEFAYSSRLVAAAGPSTEADSEAVYPVYPNVGAGSRFRGRLPNPWPSSVEPEAEEDSGPVPFPGPPVNLGKLGTKVYSYQRGDIWIDAILPPEATDPAVPVRINLKWPDPAHTYDLREQAYFGNLSEVGREVQRSSPAVLARLPYKVRGIRLRVPDSAPVGGVLKLHATVYDQNSQPRPGHVIRIQVFGPDGQERPYYGAWLDADDTPQHWRIPFALNDPPGPWTITATDVISGVSSTETFDLIR